MQNGVLVYLAIKDRKFSIIGDKGIDAKVPAEFWDTIRDEMRAYLAKNEFITREIFQKMYPRYKEFIDIKEKLDPTTLFSSNMFNRLFRC